MNSEEIKVGTGLWPVPQRLYW